MGQSGNEPLCGKKVQIENTLAITGTDGTDHAFSRTQHSTLRHAFLSAVEDVRVIFISRG